MTLWTKVREFVDNLGDSDESAPDLDEEELRLAAGALLVRATVIDGDVDSSEREVLKDVLSRRFELKESEVDALIQEATQKEKDAVDLYGFTSVLKRRLDHSERMRIVEMMWEVVIADGIIHEFEANLVWRAAELLGVTSRDRVLARKRVESRHA